MAKAMLVMSLEEFPIFAMFRLMPTGMRSEMLLELQRLLDTIHSSGMGKYTKLATARKQKISKIGDTI